MMWHLALLMTLVAYQAVMFLYAAIQAVVARWAGATVKELSVGWGPLVWKGAWGSWPCVFRLFPMGASTTFYGEEDDPEVRPSGTVNFTDVPLGRRSLINLIGPVGFILTGASLLLLPVVVSGPQVAVDKELPVIWPHPGVPGLTATRQPSTIPGQIELFRQSAVVFTQRAATGKSVEGWGGFLAWLVTCTDAAQYSLWAWSTCFGTIILWLGFMNLMPIPPLNGGHLVFNLLEAIVGRKLDSIRIYATYLGMILGLAFLFRIVMADAFWLARDLFKIGT